MGKRIRFIFLLDQKTLVQNKNIRFSKINSQDYQKYLYMVQFIKMLQR